MAARSATIAKNLGAARHRQHDSQRNGSARDSDSDDSVSTGPHVRLVSIELAAELLGIGRTTVYDLVNRGELRSTKIGRRTLLAVDDIDAFVDRKLASA